MKNIKILIFLLVSVFACKAQTVSLTNVNWLTVPDGAYVKDKNLKGSFELINTLILPNGNFTATQAHWKLGEKEFISLNGNPSLPEDGIGLPEDIILTKQ